MLLPAVNGTEVFSLINESEQSWRVTVVDQSIQWFASNLTFCNMFLKVLSPPHFFYEGRKLKVVLFMYIFNNTDPLEYSPSALTNTLETFISKSRNEKL